MRTRLSFGFSNSYWLTIAFLLGVKKLEEWMQTDFLIKMANELLYLNVLFPEASQTTIKGFLKVYIFIAIYPSTSLSVYVYVCLHRWGKLERK